MSWVNKSLVAVIAVLAAVLLVAGCSTGYTAQPGGGDSRAASTSTPSVQPTNGLVQSSEAGAVTIEVKWGGIQGNSLVFQVTMDTHSVDLDRYDLKKTTVLRDDAGNRFQAAGWNSPPGGHHRQGTLAFPVPDSLTLNEARYLEILIGDVGGIETRVFKWEL